MKFSSKKAILGLGIVSVAVALTAAYGSVQSAATEPVKAAPLVDKPSVETVAESSDGLGVVGLVAALMVAPQSTQPPAMESVEAAPSPDSPSEPACAENVVESETTSVAYEAGTLLKGKNHFVYYITEAGTRQPIYDRETFSAFGFQPKDVVEVDNDALSAIPMTDILTRLIVDDEDNLYWVVNGQRWLVNAWKPVVNGASYRGVPTSYLDSSLQDALSSQMGIKNHNLLRQDDTVYYYLRNSIIPLKEGSYDESEVVDVPSGVLAVYRQKTKVETLWAKLNADTPAANLRSGPGVNFEVIGTIYDTNNIFVIGRAENSYWLKIVHGSQTGWLAGDLVKDQGLLKLLPTINTDSLRPQKTSRQQTNNPNIYTGIGALLGTNRDGLPMIVAPHKGSPAHKAGLKIGDIIMRVDGENVTTLSVHEIVSRVRGEKGVEVTLTIFRPATNENLEFAIIRDEIDLSTVTYVCGAEPIRGFGKVWREHPEIHDPLGCPFTNFRRDEHATPAAVQIFEHGWMLWLETDTVANVDPIYVFYEDDGTFLRYGDRKLVDAHSYASTPEGFYKVGDRFAKVYWEEIGEQGRQRLGYAINEARDSLGAFQEFENGRMFWAYESDTIYVIYRGYLDLDGDGKTSWTQAWTSFEDTFEAPEDK